MAAVAPDSEIVLPSPNDQCTVTRIPSSGSRRGRPLIIADLFCGAGGTITGAKDVLREMLLEARIVAINHWKTAVATHERNHPDARHYCQDIATVDPREAIPEGYLDLLLASPSCVFHSRARGGKPTSDQQRADPWNVITWLTQLKVKRIFIENVPEFLRWGPIDPRTGRPIKSREGEYFHAWIRALEALGFKLAYKVANSADYGDATTRERFYLLGTSTGKAPRWPAPTHARTPPIGDLFGRTLEPWRSAREIIDWSVRGKSIFARPRPLSPKTLERLLTGATRMGWHPVYIAGIKQELIRSLRTCITRDDVLIAAGARGKHLLRAQKMLVYARPRLAQLLTEYPITDQPFPVNAAGEPVVIVLRNNCIGRSIGQPVPTITAGAEHIALAQAVMLPSADVGPAVPFILNRHGDHHADETGAFRARSLDEPAPASTCSGAGYIVTPTTGNAPFILSQHSGGAPRDTEEPIPGITGAGAHALVTVDPATALIMPVTHSDGSNRTRPSSMPLPAITTAKRGELAFIVAAFGERDGQTPRIHQISEPSPSICATGRIQFCEPGPHFQEGKVYVPGIHFDVLFRMFTKRELAAAMSLDDVDFVGNDTEIVKQIGNAVSRRTARAMVGALLADLPKAKQPVAAQGLAA